MKLFELWATLSLDTKSFERKVNDAMGSGTKLANALKNVTDNVHLLENIVAGNIIADGLQRIGSAMWATAQESIQLASDLEEVQNVVDVTFGDNASSVNAWARSAKAAFGMSELNAKRYSGTLGAVLKSMQLTDNEAQNMSLDLVKLAGDMASFYNLDYENAFEKIRAGIVGEMEPLRELGINMSVANIEAYALSEGITTAYEAMSEAERATLRYNYLMSVTADAQGDFARTSNNYANAMRTFGENIKEIKQGMGDSLLDFITPAINTFNTWYANLTKTNAENEQRDAQEAYDETLKRNQETYNRGEALIRTLEDLEGQTEMTEAEAYIWNRTLEDLVQTFPELKDVINLTTGEIEGGTEALREYNKSWLETAKMDAAELLMEQQRTAVASAQASLYAAEANLATTRHAADVAWEAIAGEAQKAISYLNAGIGDVEEQFSFEGTAESLQAIMAALNGAGYSDIGQQLAEMNAEYIRLQEEADGYSSTVDEARAITDRATATYKRTAEYLGYTTDEYERLTDAEKAAADVQAEFIASIEAEAATLTDLEQQLQDIADYRTDAIAKTREALDSALGLDAVDDWKIAADQLDDFQTQMQDALNSQLVYLQSYQSNLDNLRRRGVSDELLNMLSDGSAESAKMLQALVTMDEGELQGYLNTFGLVGNAKDKLASSLTDTTLAIDEDFQTMVDAAKEAADAFDFSEQTADDLAKFEGEMDAWTLSIATEVDRITTSADAAKQALSALSGVTFGGSEGIDGSHASGLGYVPYDGYIAELHRGEQILTAAEAAGRRQSVEHSPAIDYDALAEALSRRPVAVYVDRKATAMVLTREMDTQIGNRNIQQLMSMGG